ncbi:hypothetical protein J5N97_006136 [Dioscorea zingiberensis]|uniref:AP-3 complex subunit beta C-terminal domain-containing protein n=1 Tax=Dioscorea zingiberensis TaxID=325984 RepID=A0A9D5HSI1_9LILI|nr:hypothetical protein J5N97_006136 [Dioscorea zingiberensis]
MAKTCLEGLLALTVRESSVCTGDYMDHEPGILVQAIMSIKAIIKLNPASHEKIIVRLVRHLDAIKEPVARALIVWIVGEYNSVGEIIPKIVPTVLSYLAWSFSSEEVETKLQILNTAAKIAVSDHKGEHQMFRKNLSYVLELAKYDMHYDVRDRARTIEKLLECYTSPNSEDGNIGLTPNNGIIREFVERILSGKLQTTYLSANNPRFYLPGSLSQIVLHTAPGYGPLPKPCSLLGSYHHHGSEISNETRELDMRMGKTATSSGTSIEENDSDYDSEHSDPSSNVSEGLVSKSDDSSDDNQIILSAQHDLQNETESPLVHLSGVRVGDTPSASGITDPSFSADLVELMSKSTLESWLNEQPSSSSSQNSLNLVSARISVNDLDYIVKPKLRTLLDPVSGNGLKLEYAFSSEVSSLSPLLVCIEVLFENCSAESLKGISVKEDSDGNAESARQVSETSERLSTNRDLPTLVPMDEIASLDPGETVKRVLQVCFQHHLLPLKLAVFNNNKKHLIKLWPDIGYFMRPLFMNLEAFLHKESQLPGMFECTKRCTFKDHIEDLQSEGQHPSHGDRFLIVAQSLASKVLSNAHVHLVHVDMPVSSDMDSVSGLCLRFSGEILSNSKPCLITTTINGKFSGPLEVSVKVNCEESIFGLNLLNRVAAFLQ